MQFYITTPCLYPSVQLTQVVILARLCGLNLTTDSLKVENIVPQELRGLPVDEFMNKLSDFDDHFNSLLAKAAERGCCLRYVGTVDLKGACSVELKE